MSAIDVLRLRDLVRIAMVRRLAAEPRAQVAPVIALRHLLERGEGDLLDRAADLLGYEADVAMTVPHRVVAIGTRVDTIGVEPHRLRPKALHF